MASRLKGSFEDPHTCLRSMSGVGLWRGGLPRTLPRLQRWIVTTNNIFSFTLLVFITSQSVLEHILHCWVYQDSKFAYELCTEKEDLCYPYTVFTTITMSLYYVLLIDLTAVSTRIPAFSLVCVRMLSEVALFISALFVAVLAWSCAVSVMKQDNEDFAGIHKGAYSLLRMFMGMHDSKRYEVLHEDPMLSPWSLCSASSPSSSS